MTLKRKLSIGTCDGESTCTHLILDFRSGLGMSLFGWQVKAAIDNSVVTLSCALCDVHHQGSLTSMYFHLQDFHGYTPEQLGAPVVS
jgi:hypothetical protein